MPKFKGVNTKVQAANERKNAQRSAQDAKKQQEQEKKQQQEWSAGADKRGETRREAEERKRQELDAKAAEKKRLEALDAAMLDSTKLARSAKKKTKSQKAVDKPWEAALAPVAKKKGTSRRQMMMKQKEQESDDDSKVDTFDGLAPAIGLEKNRNREINENDARTMEEAISLLSVGDKDEKHPEKRAKAAYKAFEAVKLPELKQDHPGLKLSQYKERLRDMWRKSPDNPLNQAHLAYNQKK